MIKDDIKMWWSQLADRERQLLSVGGVAVALFVIYGAIWSPLSNAVTDNAVQVKTQRAVLDYMQAASATIRDLQAQGIHAVAATEASSLLATVEAAVSQHQLSLFLKQVQQPTKEQVTLSFEKVPFDQLMQCLQQLSATQGLRIVSLSAERLPAVPGTANVKVVLS